MYSLLRRSSFLVGDIHVIYSITRCAKNNLLRGYQNVQPKIQTWPSRFGATPRTDWSAFPCSAFTELCCVFIAIFLGALARYRSAGQLIASYVSILTPAFPAAQTTLRCCCRSRDARIDVYIWAEQHVLLRLPQVMEIVRHTS
jgi:hypothetical protein